MFHGSIRRERHVNAELLNRIWLDLFCRQRNTHVNLMDLASATLLRPTWSVSSPQSTVTMTDQQQGCIGVFHACRRLLADLAENLPYTAGSGVDRHIDKWLFKSAFWSLTRTEQKCLLQRWQAQTHLLHKMHLRAGSAAGEEKTRPRKQN